MTRTKGLPLLLAALLSIVAGSIFFIGPARGEPFGESKASVKLQGLDKITARIFSLSAPIGTSFRFGSLEIVARACFKAPEEEAPEAAAFLEVDELPPDAPRLRLFTGWMYASAPAVSALEHPIYDLWVVDCGEEAP